jgi:hypothetical protein
VETLLKRFPLEIDEDDEDGQDVVHALQTVVRKFSELKVCFVPYNAMWSPLNGCFKHVPFSDATVLTLTQANIKVEVLEWNSDGKSQAQHLGASGSTTQNALSLDETIKQIGYIRKHIAFEVSQIFRSSGCSRFDFCALDWSWL